MSLLKQWITVDLRDLTQQICTNFWKSSQKVTTKDMKGYRKWTQVYENHRATGSDIARRNARVNKQNEAKEQP